LEKQEQINKTREEREAKLLEKQYLAEQARIERELKKLEKIQNKKAKKTSPFDLVIQRYLETEQWLKLYKEFLQENGRNPSKDIESEKELAQNIKRIRLSNGNSKYKNLALELWNKYPTKEQLDNTENVYKDFRAFVEANGRNPKNNATDKAEKTLAIRISATKNIRDIVKSDYMQKIIDLWNQNELNVKISAWTVLYADLQKFIAENGHVPNSVSTNYEETRLRHGYHNAVKSGIEHPIIEQLKTLWQNTRKETISAANINKDLLKYQQYLDEYREFLKTNNRNPSVKAVDQQEAALAKAISNIMRNSRNRNPIAHDFRALWNMYYISKVKIVKPDADYVQEYKEFVKTNERNPNQENSKEERILFTKINAMVKDDGNPYSHELRGLWGFYSKGKQKNYIVTPDQWLTLYNNFIIQNGNKPSEAGKRSERHLAWAATYIFENTLADDPLRNKFQELFEDFETNREDYSEAADNEDFEDDIIIKTKKRNTGKEEDLATMYIDYLIKNNLGIAESTVLPKTKEEKDTFYNKYITFVNENKVIPSAFSGDKEERLLALTLKELASDVYSVEAYVGTLLGLERRFTAPATTEKLYEEFERYLEQLKLMPNRNSKFYKEIYFRLRYGTKDAKDINDFGKLYALYQVAKAVGEGEISWDDDLQMTINSNIENELAIPVEGLQQLYDGLPLNSKRIVRAMEENYQELKNHFPAWLEQNKDNIVWNDATAQALKQVEKGIKNNSSSATAALVAISQMDLGKKYDGRNNSLIYRGTDLNNLEETDFHILSERIGMYYFEEPSVPAITFKTEITKLTGLILHEGVTAKDLQETLEQIAKDGSYLIRVEKQDLGLINNTLNNDGINGKLYVHLEKTLPIANDEGISVDAAVLLEIDASALTKGKTETEIVELYKQLFRGF